MTAVILSSTNLTIYKFSMKNLFRKVSPNSQEKTCAWVSTQWHWPTTLMKMNSGSFWILGHLSKQNICRPLLLKVIMFWSILSPNLTSCKAICISHSAETDFAGLFIIATILFAMMTCFSCKSLCACSTETAIEMKPYEKLRSIKIIQESLDDAAMFEIELIKRWESEDMTKIHLDDSNTEPATRGVL